MYVCRKSSRNDRFAAFSRQWLTWTLNKMTDGFVHSRDQSFVFQHTLWLRFMLLVLLTFWTFFFFFSPFILACRELRVGKPMFQLRARGQSWEIPLFTDLRNRTRVFRCQFLYRFLFHPVRINTYFEQSDGENGVECWASSEAEYYKRPQREEDISQETAKQRCSPNSDTHYTAVIRISSSFNIDVLTKLSVLFCCCGFGVVVLFCSCCSCCC